ncbi:MAG: tRNA guanosine(34) transglycosylase Tgt [Candidatus Geothermincolia bacterium]
MRFKITGRDPRSAARRGRLHTAKGAIETPAFMPVGTRGVVKTMAPWDLEAMGFQMLLANTYHLYLRPGVEVIAAQGGLHRFMGWDGAILTDSGGYQVFSLSKTFKLSEEGVGFRSVYDGSAHFLTPERVVEVQRALGVDVAMVLDECVSYPADRSYVESSIKLSADWARRSLDAWDPDSSTALFGIVQGGMFPDLRRASAEMTVGLGFPGYGIGGFSVGEPPELMFELLEELIPLLPNDVPRYLMGVGDPEGLRRAVALGIDLFDCVLPTRLARNGTLLVPEGKLNMKNAEHRDASGPIEEGCPCAACRRFSRSYLRHLFLNREMLALRLFTEHNLTFIGRLMRNCRESASAVELTG